MDGRELVAIALGMHGGTTNKVQGNLDGPCQRPLTLLWAVTLTHNGQLSDHIQTGHTQAVLADHK